MKVGIGLPNGVPGVTCDQLLEWSRQAEAQGFSLLGSVDRFGYGCIEPLIALSMAATVTERIELASTILAMPLREGAQLAEQVESLHRLTGGRLTLGVGLGGREDDYSDSEYSWTERGRRLNTQLDWLDKQPRFNDLRIVVGGHAAAAFERTARFADGYISSGGPSHAVSGQFQSASEAWRSFGRPGNPERWATAYFALGTAAEEGHSFLSEWYSDSGSFVSKVLAGLLLDTEAVRERARAYEDLGCDLLIFLPTTVDPDQVGALASALDGYSGSQDN